MSKPIYSEEEIKFHNRFNIVIAVIYGLVLGYMVGSHTREVISNKCVGANCYYTVQGYTKIGYMDGEKYSIIIDCTAKIPEKMNKEIAEFIKRECKGVK